MEEVWRPVVGFEGLYEVSNFGNVKRAKSLKWQITKFGYARVSLWDKGVQRWQMVHRLVAEAFLPNPENLPQVNHKDENKLNNFVYVNPDGSVDPERSNLEWCSAQYNNTYGSRIEKSRQTFISRKCTCKRVRMLSLDNHVLREFDSITEAGKSVGCRSIGNISSCCDNKYRHKTAYGYRWEWARP